MENNTPTHKAKSLDGTWVEGWYDGSVEDALLWLNDKVRPFRAINPPPSAEARTDPTATANSCTRGMRWRLMESHLLSNGIPSLADLCYHVVNTFTT